MFFKQLVLLVVSLFISINTFAGVIENGDFSTCDYSSWQTDTDGFSGSANDFFINNNGSSCNAEIQVDHFGTVTNDAFFANTLFQALDFTGTASSTWLLSIDFAVNSEITSNDPLFIADYFMFGLNDGAGNYFNETGNTGFLVDPTDIDGLFEQTLSVELSSSFTNTSGWFLDLQLNLGVDGFGWTDAFGSSLFINEVSLVEKLADSTPVPEPSTLLIFALGLIGLISRKNLKS